MTTILYEIEALLPLNAKTCPEDNITSVGNAISFETRPNPAAAPYALLAARLPVPSIYLENARFLPTTTRDSPTFWLMPKLPAEKEKLEETILPDALK